MKGWELKSQPLFNYIMIEDKHRFYTIPKPEN